MSTQKVKVTLIRSPAGQLRNIAETVRGLGLRRIRHSVVLTDTPEVRGLIRAAQHLLKIEESR